MDYFLSNGNLNVKFSSLGGELRSIKSGSKEYLWNGDSTYWSGQAPLLFPYVGRFTDGKYRFADKFYEMTIHGFAKFSEFSVTAQTPDSIEFTLTQSEKTLEIYPFAFILKVKYTLVGRKILIRYSVDNPSDNDLYFGIGAHPGFALPLGDGINFSDYYLEFSSPSMTTRIAMTPSSYVGGEDTLFQLENQNRLNLTRDLFDNDAIVLKHMPRCIALKCSKSDYCVTLDYPDMPYLGIWQPPHKDSPFICIEPWTSLPSRQGVIEDFQQKSELTCLHPNAHYENNWSISIR